MAQTVLKILLIIAGQLAVEASADQSPSFRVLPDAEVQFNSSLVVYREGLRGGRWVGRYWAADGRPSFPTWQFDEPAFQLQVLTSPNAGPLEVNVDWQTAETISVTPRDRERLHVVTTLRSASKPVEIRIHTLLDETPVLVRYLEIKNTSDQPVAIQRVSPLAGRLWPRAHHFTLGYQTRSDALYEGWFQWKELLAGETVVASKLGNGHDDPFVIIRNDVRGEYFICHFAWSANWSYTFTNVEDSSSPQAGLTFCVEPKAHDVLRVIEPGETVETPAVHLGLIAGTLDDAVQAMHEHVRQSVQPARPSRANLIQFAVPGDQGYWSGDNFNEQNMRRAIDVASAIGAEMILLDAGWYDVYGDWTPSATRFPEGLEPLREYARSKGLLFGLQTECEGGRRNWPESRVFREHPEWFSPQHVLDLSRPETASYVERELIRVVESYHPDLYRHEFIPEFVSGNELFTYEFQSTPRSGFTENNYWRYYDNYYRLFRSVRSKFPSLIMQHCANGGTRDDLGNMSCFHETYTNEGEPPRILQSYCGKSLAIPPEAIVIGFGGQPERGHLATYLRCAFSLSTPWLLSAAAPSPDDLTPQVRDEYRRYTQLYKDFLRPVMQNCRMYHHAPVSARSGVTDSQWFAVEFASRDRSRGWATIVRLAESAEDHYLTNYSPIIERMSAGPIGESTSDVYRLMPRGLDVGRQYAVTFDSTGKTVVRDGYELAQQGLAIRLEAVQSSELVLFRAVQ